MVRLSPWRLAGGRVRPTVCEAVVLSTHSPSSGRNRVIPATNHAARTPGGRIPTLTRAGRRGGGEWRGNDDGVSWRGQGGGAAVGEQTVMSWDVVTNKFSAPPRNVGFCFRSHCGQSWLTNPLEYASEVTSKYK